MRAAKRRVTDLVEGAWAAKAVRDAVPAAVTAVTTTSIATTVIITS